MSANADRHDCPLKFENLQTRAVDDLHVNSELTAAVVEDKDADGTTTRLEGARQTRPQVGLVNDSEALLDITALSHGNNVAVLHVKDTVLLEDRAEHGLDNNTGGGVGDEGGLFVELLGEEIDTKVAVLASSIGGGNADDLARAALEHQEVSETNVVAGNGDSVGEVRSGITTAVAGRGTGGGDIDILADVNVNLLTVATRVGNAVSQLVHAVTEGVVVT